MIDIDYASRSAITSDRFAWRLSIGIAAVFGVAFCMLSAYGAACFGVIAGFLTGVVAASTANRHTLLIGATSNCLTVLILTVLYTAIDLYRGLGFDLQSFPAGFSILTSVFVIPGLVGGGMVVALRQRQINVKW